MYSCSLSSSSSGNSIYIETASESVNPLEARKKTRILIDAGLSMKNINSLLRNDEVYTGLEEINAIFITHEHIDHVRGLDNICKSFPRIPVYMNELSFSALKEQTREKIRESVVLYDVNTPVRIGTAEVKGFRTPHDSAYSMGFTVSEGEKKSVGVATDIGCISSDVYTSLANCATVYIESNHDVSKLKAGRKYPEYLKRRILSDTGHLSNDDCAAFLPFLVENGARNIILYHLSGENNTADFAYTAAARSLVRAGYKKGDVVLQVAPKDTISRPVSSAGELYSERGGTELLAGEA